LSGHTSKNRPKTKVVELFKGYKSRLGAFFNRGPRWPAKRKIHFRTRRFWDHSGSSTGPSHAASYV